MAEPRQSKRRIQLPVFSGGGGGIEALVVWGGALAVTGLVAAFTVRKGRREDEIGDKKKQGQIDIHESAMKEVEDSRSKGLQSGIPEAPPFPNGNSRERFYEMSKNDNSESVSTRDLDGNGERGENKNASGGPQEILLSDTEQESIAISDDYCVAEEFPSQPSSHESENIIRDERKGKGSPKVRSFCAEHATEEKPSSRESSEDEEEEEDEEDSRTHTSMSSTEEEDESSAIQSTLSTDQEGKEEHNEETEGSRSSSVESKMDPIWPAEMVEILSSGTKDANLYRQLSEEKYKKDAKTGEYPYLGRTGGAENMKVIKNNNATEYANVAYRSLPPIKRTIFINSILILMVLVMIANILWSFYISEISSVIP